MPRHRRTRKSGRTWALNVRLSDMVSQKRCMSACEELIVTSGLSEPWLFVMEAAWTGRLRYARRGWYARDRRSVGGVCLSERTSMTG
jgi:hypothetical protein